MNTHLHVVFEDVGSSGHVHDVVDYEFAESREQISPFVESLDLVGLVFLVSLWRQKEISNKHEGFVYFFKIIFELTSFLSNS